MLKVIDWVLQKCGSSLEKTLNSEGFAALLKNESEINATDPDSDAGVALRAGHLDFGNLINRLPEKEAVERARVLNGSIKPSPEERALIHLTGDAIVSAAADCLPENVLQMANRWKMGTAEEQLLISRDLYLEFCSDGQISDDILSMELISKKLAERQNRLPDDDRGYLPGFYQKWNKATCLANCQGKSQMLVAFAELAGAECAVVHPVVHAKDYVGRKRREIKHAILSDLAARGLENASSEFADGLLASNFDDRMRDKDAECFHVGVALRLNDGRWVIVDSHGLSWGLIPENWNLPLVREMLKKYAGALPGLTILAGNLETGKDLVDGIIAQARDLIERSRKMEENIRLNVRTMGDFLDILCASDDLEHLINLNEKAEGRGVIDLSDPQVRKTASMLIAMGGERNLLNISAMMDPVFLKKQVNNWLTFYHCCAMNIIVCLGAIDGVLVHPVCEISADSHWALAIAAINSASFDCYGGRNVETATEFFIRNSFDQTSLFNAASLARRPLGIAAQKTLKNLVFLHPMCAKMLGDLERREEYGW